MENKWNKYWTRNTNAKHRKSAQPTQEPTNSEREKKEEDKDAVIYGKSTKKEACFSAVIQVTDRTLFESVKDIFEYPPETTSWTAIKYTSS